MNRYHRRTPARIVAPSEHEHRGMGCQMDARASLGTRRRVRARVLCASSSGAEVCTPEPLPQYACRGPYVRFTRGGGSQAIRRQDSNDDATGKRLWLLIGLVVVVASVVLLGSIFLIVRSNEPVPSLGLLLGLVSGTAFASRMSVRIRLQSNK